MREIKFRAWDGEHMLFLENGQFTLTHCGIVAGNDSGRAAIQHWPLMQFTGLLDKNGREIYEGDIVKWEPDWIRMRDNPKVVQWGGSGIDPFQYSGGGEWNNQDCVVIGNVHESPELIAGKSV